MSDKQLINLGDSDDVKLVGGKAHSLSDMIRAGFVVPEGFIISTKVLHKMAPELEKQILGKFDGLQADFVAVRSSAVAEDGAEAAWAGQLDTFLNVTRRDLIASIRKCWESAHSARAEAYAKEKSLQAGPVGVVVQKMIQGDVSGVAFSVHPITSDRNQIIIEAGLGLGEAVVSGQITPDSYVADKRTQKILERHLSEQTKKLVKAKDGGDTWQDIGAEGAEQKLTDEQIVELVRIVIKLEGSFGFPVDVEWSLADGKLYILQSRPITTLAG